LNTINPTMARSSSPAEALAARDSRSSSSARNSRDGGPPGHASCSATRRARFGLRPPAGHHGKDQQQDCSAYPAGTQSPIAEVDQPGAGSRHHHGAHRNQDDTQPGNAEQGGDLRDVVPPPAVSNPAPATTAPEIRQNAPARWTKSATCSTAAA